MKDAALKISDRLTYKKKEVIKITKLEGRVLDFWEKEFAVVKPVVSQSGDKFYSRQDVEAILRIRQLLIVEKKDKDEVRRILDEEMVGARDVAATPLPSAMPRGALRRIRQGLKEILTLLDKNDKR